MWIPTIAEAGLPGYESAQRYAAGTGQEIITCLHQATTAIRRSSNSKERLAASIKADIAKGTKFVRSIGLSPM